MKNKTVTYTGYMLCFFALLSGFNDIHNYTIMFFTLGNAWLIASFFIKD